MATCTACRRPLPPNAPDAYLCPLCTHQLAAWLGEIPRHAVLLPRLLQPAGAPRAGSIRASRANPPLPAREDVLTLLGPGHPIPPADGRDQVGDIPLRAWAMGWADYAAAQHPAVGWDAHGTARVQPCEAAHSSRGTTLGAWLHWLRAYLPTIAAQPWARHFHEATQDLIHRLRRLTGVGTQLRTTLDTPCPECSCFGLLRGDGGRTVCIVCGQGTEAEEKPAVHGHPAAA